MAAIAELAADDSQTTHVSSDEGAFGNETHFSSRDGNLSVDDLKEIIEAIFNIESAIEEEREKSAANVVSDGDIDPGNVFSSLHELRLEEYDSGEEYRVAMKCKVVGIQPEAVLKSLDDLHKFKQIHQNDLWSGILNSIPSEKPKFPAVMILFYAVCTEETQNPDTKKEKSFDLPIILDDKALRIVATIDGKEYVIND